MNHDFLKYIIEFEKAGSLVKASENLFVSQSALTRALQKLEQEVGVPLFNRTKNKIELNIVGVEFVNHAKRIISLENEALESSKRLYYSLTSLMYGSVAPGPIMKYSNLIYSTFEDMTISVRLDNQENLIRGIERDFYDFAILNERIENDEYSSIPLFNESLSILIPCDHPLSTFKDGVKFSDLNGQQFFMVKNIGAWEKLVRNNMPNTKFKLIDFEDLNDLINKTNIPSFVTNISISTISSESNRLLIPILDKKAAFDYYLVYKKSKEAKLKILFSKL